MERIVLKHLNGSKTGQEEQFPLSEFKEIILGRDQSSSVRFNDESEAMVGRQHARITRNIALPSQFFITDLNSRNGTFVNGRRIVGRVGLKSGDVVQCGAGGPEFRFMLEPETSPLTAETAALTAETAAPAADLPEYARSQPPGPGLPLAASSVSSVGAAVAPAREARVDRSKAPAGVRWRKPLIVGGGVLIVLAALVAGGALYRSIGSSGSGEEGQVGATPK